MQMEEGDRQVEGENRRREEGILLDWGCFGFKKSHSLESRTGKERMGRKL